MGIKELILVYGILLFFSKSYCFSKNDDLGVLWNGGINVFADKTPNSVESPLLIGSFNIQTLSAKKFSKANVMTIIENIILRYDLIYIMEILTIDPTYMQKLLTVINSLVPAGARYNMSLSPYHPQNQERSAFLYRTDKLQIIKVEAYDGEKEKLYRRPYIAHFKSMTLRDMDSFVAVGLHVRPSQAVQEINALASVYDYVTTTYKIKDVLLMGDFNADCDYVKEGDWAQIALWTRLDFRWAIQNHQDTTTNHKSCALDRFVYAGDNMINGIIVSSAKVFNFQETFGLTIGETREVSDHWPIEIQIRGKMSGEAEKDLSSLICTTVTNSRLTKLPNVYTILNQVKYAGFSPTTKNSTQINFIKQSNTKDEVFESLRKLSSSIPELVSVDQLQGIIYKVRYGSLKDSSSFADISQPIFFTKVLYLNQRSTVTVCRRTSVN